jgi:error-prone DNA polymerase
MTSGWGTPYVELHCHSAYSLCDGVSSPADLVAQAAELGMEALALTDHDALYGAIPFVQAAEACGIHPILGAEVTMVGGPHLTLLVANNSGWRNLSLLISRAQAQAPKGQAALPWGTLAEHTEGLLCLTGCRKGPVAAAIQRLDMAAAERAAHWLCDHFGPEHTFVEVQHHLHPGDAPLARRLVDLAHYLHLTPVAANNAHYARRDQHPLHDVLTAIRHHTPLDQAGRRLRGNSEYYLKSGGRLRPLFADHPELLTNTLRVAEQCAFRLSYGLQDLPQFPTPPGYDADKYLARLCADALPRRYPGRPERACRQLAYELRVIAQASLSNYVLIVWDIVRFAREQGIRCQGRGSAANSLVAYLLGISPIDPLAHDLVFERFLSSERPALPDIDLDIAADRREEVIQYVFHTYGTAHAAMACTFSTFGARAALRDVARVLGVTSEHLITQGDHTPDHIRVMAAELCRQLDGLPRHLGQHNGGMVLSRAPLAERVPIEPAAMPGRTVVQWDKDMLEDAGLVKIDLLGLRMLAALTEAEALVRATCDPCLDLDRLTFDDPRIYEMLTNADTIGVFQVESRAQSQVLPKLRPTCFADIVVAISLIRPGPLQGDMVHPYLRRRLGLEPVVYAHPRLKPALEETLGVILFQEQVLKVAHTLAGLTPGEGERLRRALGSGRGPEAVAPLRQGFVAGAQQNGVPEAVALRVFEQLQAFGGYSFPKSHAAAFAVIVYQSAYLKRYHPAALLVALLNNQPMGFWPPAVLVRDARRHGVRVLPLDIEQSDARCTLVKGAVRLGLNYVLGLGEAGAARICATRRERRFTSLPDFCQRTRLPRRLIETLILAGGCDGWGRERRQLLWELGTLRYEADTLDLQTPGSPVELPTLAPGEAQALQLALLGVSTEEHVLARWREVLVAQGFVQSSELAQCLPGQRVQVVGTVVIHQAPPTAKGFHFLTLEDEEGMVNVIIGPHLVPLYHERRTGHLLMVEGVIQREGDIVNLLATRLRPLVRA